MRARRRSALRGPRRPPQYSLAISCGLSVVGEARNLGVVAAASFKRRERGADAASPDG